MYKCITPSFWVLLQHPDDCFQPANVVVYVYLCCEKLKRKKKYQSGP